ncbi:Alpha/Beta hydrolase protein [Ilyonectria robusta]|uniref:Alpha/Beta hydrolase protein n=1 Tax=Ilyonectria robusta TaxID=1079257 RepID=UPI001E8DD4A3|nr:Alpha/Beta hydrolase protein [Ilyonectria robusta]KAH8737306.1 Alpha/Beta hydrolase protein [Ilyonectria robusta]
MLSIRFLMMALAASGLPSILAKSTLSAYPDDLTVATDTGTYTGLRNENYAGVREFRNIPFAQQPVGKLRWQPPVALPRSDAHHFSTRFPPSCPQFVSKSKSLWNQFLPSLMINNGEGGNQTHQVAQTSSEDCLSLAVWTPYGVKQNAKLPVLFFMTGGGFQSGGIEIPSQLPAQWIDRTQSHIVVTINYRVNIFGFPNAAALKHPNLGILDQRMALEWVAANIRRFGGDPKAITLWGQSAGAESTDYLLFSHWDDPIAHAAFIQSGTALVPLKSADYEHANFTYVAKNVGCDFPNDAAAELSCMQQVPYPQLVNFINTHVSAKKIIFGPIADEKICFSNYTQRAAQGKMARIPAIISNCAKETASLNGWPDDPAAGPDPAKILSGTLTTWVCTTAATCKLRDALNAPTYRYQFAGNFSNLSPLPWMGAFHASDLFMNFGTYELPGDATEHEAAVSRAMQDHILAFARSPHHGAKSMGWAPYHYGSNVIRFGGSDGKVTQNVSGYEIDGPCYGNGTYDLSP